MRCYIISIVLYYTKDKIGIFPNICPSDMSNNELGVRFIDKIKNVQTAYIYSISLLKL